MTKKDKTAQEPDDRLDWVLGRVLEPTERLRQLQTDLDALLAGAMTQFNDLLENRDEGEYTATALRRLESLLTQVQGKAGEALALSGCIASAVDQGIRAPSQEAE